MTFERDLVAVTPALRRFATRFTSERADIDDLVQATMLKALSRMDLFVPGSNIRSWTFTILRNLFMSEYVRRRREPALPDAKLAEQRQIPPSQEWAVRTGELACAINGLPTHARQALLMVAGGDSYSDTAAVCGCEIGTVKSRVSRARLQLLRNIGEINTVEIYSGCL